jgi:hypothetical protein
MTNGTINASRFGTTADVLAHHIDAGLITREQVAVAGRKSFSTACRWVNGEIEPSVGEFFLLVERLPRAVADDLCVLVPNRCAKESTDRELDRDQDGKLTLADVTEGVIDSGRAYINQLDTVRSRARSNDLDMNSALALVNLLTTDIRETEATLEIVKRVAATKGLRIA